jgi:hypothetical protein
MPCNELGGCGARVLIDAFPIEQSNVVEAPMDGQNCSPPVRASTVFRRKMKAVRGVSWVDSGVTVYRSPSPAQTPFDTAVRYSPKPQHTRTVRIVSGACFQPLIASFRRRAWIFGRLRPSLAPSLLSRSWIEQCGVDEHGYTCSAPKMDTLSDWTLRRELRKSHRLYSCNLESFPHQITPIRSSRCAYR